MSPIELASPLLNRDRPDHTRLTQAVQQLEGVFVEQLFKAMRETVPTDGLTSGGPGEQMFFGLLDQRLSEIVPQQWSSSMGDALLARFRLDAPAASTTEVPR
jgi:flagellar protein FlgJ